MSARLPLRVARPRPLLLGAGLTAALVGTLLTAPSPTATAVAPASRSVAAAASGPTTTAARAGGRRVARTWSAAYMSDDHEWTAGEAKTMARRFDLVAALPISFKDHVGAMRAKNRDLVLLAYANATLASSAAYAGLPEGAFAHDTAGRRITSPGFGTTLMESSNIQWRDRADQQCTDRAAAGGYDGCLIDMLTLGIFSKGFVSALPVNPATGKEYSQEEYREQMKRLSAHYRSRGPALVEVGNSVENAYRYWQDKVSSRPLVGAQPASQMEDFMRGAGTDVKRFPGAEDWKRNLKVVLDMERKGKTGLFSTKLWVPASGRQVRNWQAYAMATFLLGAGGRSYFHFTRTRDKAGAMLKNAPYRMPRGIGAPKGGVFKRKDGSYLRRFARGLAVVNPTGKKISLKLASPMKSLSGRTVRRVTLGPRRGNVLVRARR